MKCKQSILREFIIIICNSNLYTIIYTAYIYVLFFGFFLFTADLKQDRLTPKCLLYDGHPYLLLKCPSLIIIGNFFVGKCKLIFYTGTLKQKIKIAILKIIKRFAMVAIVFC